MVVLGAISSVNDPDPWIAEELDWLRAADQAGLPVLGICFGAQALCAAFGGRVEAMAGQEIGWTMVESADHGLVPPGPWLEFHGDRCLLPAAATVLARNQACVQAFRLGRHLAVQFHPEVDGPQLKRWLDAGGDRDAERAGLDLDQFLADTIREEPAARERADRLVAASLHISGQPQPLRPGRSCSAVIVACIAANGRPAPSANASPRHTIRVRPARTTWPVIVNRCPAAGASRLMV